METKKFNDGSYATVHEDLYKETGTKITDKYFTPFQLKGKIFHWTRQGYVEVTGVGNIMKMNIGQMKVDTIAMKE